MASFGTELRQETREIPRMQTPPSPTVPFTVEAVSKVAVLGPTLKFKGELSAEEDFILQGRIEGSINHTQSVTIGAEGSVLGNIHARVITIDGTVEGDLHGTDSVVVHATGRVAGNIFAPRVGLVEGSFFNGRIEMPDPKSRAPHSNRPAGVPMTAEETERMLASKPPGL